MNAEPTNDTRQRCTNCKCWRDASDYIGARNVPVKRCSKCRAKDAKQKKRPDVVEKRNERQREKQYYKTHREKKRAEDEAAYLAYNAKMMKEWREKNIEHMKAWRRNNANFMLNATRHSAARKNFEWMLDKDHALEMMSSPCVYCGNLPDDRVNGIDRMDSLLGYAPDNCVPCCKTCNYMKLRLDPETFIRRCRHISGVEIWPDAWPTSGGPAMVSTYRRRAMLKGLDFELTDDEFADMVSRPCAYCGGGAGSNGVDRMDNSEGYALDNCTPCCAECNYMKKVLTPDEFREACAAVSRHARPSTVSTKRCIYAVKK